MKVRKYSWPLNKVGGGIKGRWRPPHPCITPDSTACPPCLQIQHSADYKQYFRSPGRNPPLRICSCKWENTVLNPWLVDTLDAETRGQIRRAGSPTVCFEGKTHISGPVRFKPLLLKGQLLDKNIFFSWGENKICRLKGRSHWMDEENTHTTVYPGKIHALPGLREKPAILPGRKSIPPGENSKLHQTFPWQPWKQGGREQRAAGHRP